VVGDQWCDGGDTQNGEHPGEAMKDRLLCAVVLLAALSACCAEEDVAPPPDLSGLEEIRIDYEKSGWVFVEERFTIKPAEKPDAFVLHGRYETGQGRVVEVEMPVSSQSVAAFVREATSPAWARERGVQALAQGVDQRALRTFDAVVRVPASPCSDEELQQLAKRHFGRAALVALIDDHYGHGISWTDDYPHALVQMRWRDKPAFVMSSRSQKALMLPWDPGVPVDAPPERDQNWSLPLSRSVQALLPRGSRAYQRLGGMGVMEQRLNGHAMYKAERQCEAIRSRSDEGSAPSRQ
jgi:hypothetical protein